MYVAQVATGLGININRDYIPLIIIYNEKYYVHTLIFKSSLCIFPGGVGGVGRDEVRDELRVIVDVAHGTSLAR